MGKGQHADNAASFSRFGAAPRHARPPVYYIALFLKRRQNLGDGLSPVTKDVRGPHRGPWSDLDVGTGCVVCAVPDLPIDRCTTPADSRGRRQERPRQLQTSIRRDWPSAARGRKKAHCGDRQTSHGRSLEHRAVCTCSV